MASWAREGADNVSAWAMDLCDVVLQPQLLQASYDRAAQRPTATATLTGSETAELAAIAAKNLTQALPLLFQLSTRIASIWGPEPAPVFGENGNEQVAMSADALSAVGALREATLVPDINALSPVNIAGFPVPVSRAGSAVLLPQYCMRVGEPGDGAAYAPHAAGVLSEALLGGMAPANPALGKYSCVVRRAGAEQPSLNDSLVSTPRLVTPHPDNCASQHLVD
jgi:hypothetical protein